MSHLARHLFTLCSAVSLLLCVAVCVLWVRSYGSDDRLMFWRGGLEYALRSSEGRLAVGNDHLRDDRDARSALWKAEFKALRAREEAVDARLLEIGRARADAPPAEFVASIEESLRLHRKLDELDEEHWRNFAANRADIERYSASLGPGAAWSYGVPHAVLAGVLLLLPGTRLAIAFRGGRRRSKGRCSSCGYDLRATPGRCPECGTVPAV